MTANPRAATVVFDLDGTLIDSAPGIHRCLSETFAHFGIPALTAQTFQPLLGPPFRTSLPALVGERNVDEVLVHYRSLYSGGGMFETSLYPGIAELVTALRRGNVRLAVATSKLDAYTEPILTRLGVADCFEVLCGHVEPHRNTKTLVVEEALAQLGRPDPDTVVMVGDRRHDVVGAQANGVPALGAGWGYGAPGELAAAGAVDVFDTPAELGRYLGSS